MEKVGPWLGLLEGISWGPRVEGGLGWTLGPQCGTEQGEVRSRGLRLGVGETVLEEAEAGVWI